MGAPSKHEDRDEVKIQRKADEILNVRFCKVHFRRRPLILFAKYDNKFACDECVERRQNRAKEKAGETRP